MKENQKTPKNWTELAKILGVSRQALTYHRKGPDAPRLEEVSRWQLLLAAVGRECSVPADLKQAIAEKRLAILTQTEIAEKRKNAIAEGRVLDVVEVSTAIRACVAQFFAGLDRFLDELPPAVAGMDAPAIAERSREALEKLKSDMRSRLSALEKTESAE